MWEAAAPGLKVIRKTGPIVYVGIVAGTGLLLFLPNGIIAQMGLIELQAQYGWYFGLLFVVSLSLLAAHGFAELGPIERLWREWQIWSRAYKALKGCTPVEKAFLRQYIVDEEKPVHAPTNDGVANGLRRKGIVYAGDSLMIPGQPSPLLPWNLQPFSRAVLAKHRSLLD